MQHLKDGKLHLKCVVYNFLLKSGNLITRVGGGAFQKPSSPIEKALSILLPPFQMGWHSEKTPSPPVEEDPEGQAASCESRSQFRHPSCCPFLALAQFEPSLEQKWQPEQLFEQGLYIRYWTVQPTAQGPHSGPVVVVTTFAYHTSSKQLCAVKTRQVTSGVRFFLL